MDHVRELQGRLFAVGAAFIVVSAAAYPFFDKIVNVLVAPLGKDHELVYLTPAGAFSFIIQVCMYVGLLGALPAIIYNVYRFVMPAMKERTIKKALAFTISSLVLVVAGMLFAYYIGLPAALYFLTSFNLYHINPMLTIDSYFSFVMTYMLAGAVLFQIPLIMLIINRATPLNPKGLMKHQDKIILGSFIVAAVISPTPDALNQTLLASPIIVMYQVGIILVWFSNRRKRKLAKQVAAPQPAGVPSVVKASPVAMEMRTRPPVVSQPKPAVVQVVQHTAPTASRVMYGVDGFVTRKAAASRRLATERALPPLPARPQRPNASVRVPMRRSIDGFVISA